jgi:transposase InsO family protein
MPVIDGNCACGRIIARGNAKTQCSNVSVNVARRQTRAYADVLRSHWVLVVMDQCTRRLVGFGVQCGTVTAADVCRMFNSVIRGHALPRYVSTDHDRLESEGPRMHL